MKTEEFDKQFRNKIDSLQGIPPGASWSKEQTWEKLSQKMSGKSSNNWFKYAAASFTILLVKSQNIFAGASIAVKTTIIVAATAAVTTTAVYVSKSNTNNDNTVNTKNNTLIAQNNSNLEIIPADSVEVDKNPNDVLEINSEIKESSFKIEASIINETKTKTESETPLSDINKKESVEIEKSNPEILISKSDENTDFTSPEIKSSKPINIDISDILFKRNSVEIISKSYSELNYLLEIMRRNPDLKLLVVGYTDTKEKDEDKLSSDRGYIIYKYLAGQGVETSRITYKGYGTLTKYSSKTEEGRELNRRAEIILSE